MSQDVKKLFDKIAQLLQAQKDVGTYEQSSSIDKLMEEIVKISDDSSTRSCAEVEKYIDTLLLKAVYAKKINAN